MIHRNSIKNTTIEGFTTNQRLDVSSVTTSSTLVNGQGHSASGTFQPKVSINPINGSISGIQAFNTGDINVPYDIYNNNAVTAQIQKFGKTTIAELSSGIGQVASIANNMGVSFEQVLAATSAATLGAIETNQAYTGLNAIFANIIRPTKEASKEASRLGIEFSSAALKSKGLSKFLMDITQSSKFSSTSLEKLFSSTEATKVIMSLAGAQSEDFAKILAEVNDETKRAVTYLLPDLAQGINGIVWCGLCQFPLINAKLRIKPGYQLQHGQFLLNSNTRQAF